MELGKTMTEETFEIQHYLKVMSKYKWLIVLGAFACLTSAFIITAKIPPVYETSIQLLVSQKQAVFYGSSSGDAYQATLLNERLAKTFSRMLESRSTAEKVIERLDLPISPVELVHKVKAEPIRDMQLIKVIVQDRDPVRAQLIANALGEIFPKTIEDIERKNGGIGAAQSQVSISVVDPAVEPIEPVKPRAALNLVLAFFVGAIASTFLAFMLSYFDTTIKEVDEVEQLSGLISLGRIPVMLKNSEELVVKTEPQSVVAEAFRMLRTNMQYINFESTIKTIVITSAGMGEGKTLFSANIAAVMAYSGHRVLLVSCDMRKPRLHQIFGLSNERGLASALVEASSIQNVIQKTSVKNLDIVVSGPTPPNTVDLLESKRMKQFLEGAGRSYDYVIIDSPPVTMVTDALVLANHADGVVMIARYGATKKQAFANAQASLDKVNARVLGFVLNAVNDTEAYCGNYRYYENPYTEDIAPAHPTKKWARLFAAMSLLAGALVLILSSIR